VLIYTSRSEHIHVFPTRARTRTHTHTKHNTRFMNNTGHFIILSVITNIYNKKTKGPTLMELFTATGKLINFFFCN